MEAIIDKRIEELEKKVQKAMNKVKKETEKEYFNTRKVIDLCVEVENFKGSLNEMYLIKGRTGSVEK